MGWTESRAYYWKNGKIDRKAEMDHLYTQKNHTDVDGHYYPDMCIVKSCMKGTTYHAVVQTFNLREVISNYTFPVTVLTKVKDGCIIYKDVSEPSNFPVGYLKYLTKSEYNDKFKAECLEANEKEKEKQQKEIESGQLPLKDYNIGDVLLVTSPSGKPTYVYKRPAAYQFKRPFWMVLGDNCYVPTKHMKHYKKVGITKDGVHLIEDKC